MRKFVLIVGLGAVLAAQSAFDAAKKSFEAMSGYKSSLSKTIMTLRDANGHENIRKLEMKKIEHGDGDRSLITFLYPLDIKETKLLSVEKLKEDDSQWLYMPALKRTKRIASSNKSGSFMASEFSYEDIAAQNYQKFTYEEPLKIVDKEFALVRFPKDAKSGYSKQVLYIDTTTYLPRFGIYYDKLGKPYKEIRFLEYKKIENIWRIVRIEMQNLQTGKSSELYWEEDSVHAEISADEVSQRALR
jgi:hypothetical protein